MVPATVVKGLEYDHVIVHEPADIVDVVLFMASDASRYMTGAILDVSGGLILA